LEVDEYDSAFFAKWPKFHSYRPDIVVITSVEFDHGDIYQSVDEIALEFERLIARVPAEGHVLVYDDAPRLAEVVESTRNNGWLKAKLWYYGEKESSPFRLVKRTVTGRTQDLELLLNGEQCTLSSQLTGPQNAANYAAAAGVGKLVGLSCEEIGHGLGAFRGVARRQDVKDDINGITVIDDFAHHPTAVRLTVQGIRESYGNRRLVVAYEPRSNTSSRAFFQQDYVESFGMADVAVIAQLNKAGGYVGTGGEIQSLDVDKLVSDLAERGVTAHPKYSLDAVEEFVVNEAQKGDVIVLMSNGDFGGLMPRVLAGLRKREGLIESAE
jgi:UDP-N-acetylmuramate: L-alanyl-gamma-D-glutamyl-meso-diaminopimelate ligase